MILYYWIRPEYHGLYLPEEKILIEGIACSSSGSEVGLVAPEIKNTPFDKKINKPTWMDSQKAILCRCEKPREGRYVYFYPFTDKIRVFDADIASLIVDQEWHELLEGDEDQEVFYTGQTLEHLYVQYWDSMMTLDEYESNKPYPNAEIFIFEDIPPEHLHTPPEK